MDKYPLRPPIASAPYCAVIHDRRFIFSQNPRDAREKKGLLNFHRFRLGTKPTNRDTLRECLSRCLDIKNDVFREMIFRDRSKYLWTRWEKIDIKYKCIRGQIRLYVNEHQILRKPVGFIAGR